MEELLKHHIHETERRFDEVMGEFEAVHEHIAKLQEFKIYTLTSAKWLSVIVSVVCGLITFAASTAVSYAIGR